MPPRRTLLIGVAIAIASVQSDRIRAGDPPSSPGFAGDLDEAIRQAAEFHERSAALERRGKYAEATSLAQKALDLCENALGPDEPLVAAALNSLAGLLQVQGRYETARPLLERALRIIEKAVGADDPIMAASLDNLGLLLHHQGQLDAARPLLERALRIQEKAVGPDDLSLTPSLTNLAGLLSDQGEIPSALPLLRRALAIKERSLGPNVPDVARSLHNLAATLQQGHQLDAARPLYERALTIWERSLGSDHPDVGRGLANLATMLREQGRIDEARPLVERALAIWESAFGPEHPLVATALESLAALAVRQGRFEAATPLLERALEIDERAIHRGFAGLAESERIRFASSLRHGLDAWLELAPHVGRSGYPEVLRFKGLVARAASAERTLLRSIDPTTAVTVESLRSTERRLAQLANASPPARDTAGRARWRGAYAEAAADRERLSLALSHGIAQFRTALERLDLGVRDVQAGLRAGEALVDFLKSDDHYLAWVVRRSGEPVRMDLGAAEAIESAVESFGDTVREFEQPADPLRVEAASRLRALIWEKIAANLGSGITTVYVSPDAAIATVPFAALPGSRVGTFLIDEIGVIFVTMAQDLVAPPLGGPLGSGAVVVGGVDFSFAAVSNGAVGDPLPRAPSETADRAPSGREFAPLPATGTEAKAIGAIVGDGALVLVGSDATESRLRRESKGRRILHLATHGFVRDDLMRGLRRRDDDRAELPGMDLERHMSAGHDPMLLSGLAMAGANPRDGGSGDDGILTALEASFLDLSGCELVVLSACETARGTAESGQGVLGLVSGFEVAGARRVIGSLWKVDDEGTRRLMLGSYERMLRRDGPLDPSAALRESALELRSWKDAAGRTPFAAPRYWAAFVAYGK